MSITRILLVEDETMLRRGLRALIEGTPGYEIVAEAKDGREAVELAQRHDPDVIVTDLTMPNMNGIDAIRALRDLGLRAKIVVLTVSTSSRMLADALGAGAVGYVLKSADFAELLDAIAAAKADRMYVSPSIAHELVARGAWKKAASGGGSNSFQALTDREREVLQMLVEGVPAKEVAVRLGVSVKTVEAHRRQIMDKLRLDSLATLTKYAIREGITTLDA